MSDDTANSTSLDPARPWITDERQLPSKMNWIDSLFNPAGTSSKLHFTRVWTICFFLQFLIVVVPFALGILLSLAGGDASSVKGFGLYASPIVFIVTTIISFVAHSRRLGDAGKPAVLAVMILLPLIIGLALSGAGIMSSSAKYDTMYAERAVYLENPEAWRETQLEKRKEAQEEARIAREAKAEAGEDENGEANGQGQRRGPPGGMQGPKADQKLPSQLDFILKPNVGVIQRTLVIFNLFLVIWTLTWVGRVPDFGEGNIQFSKLLLSPSGRISQDEFWIGWLILVGGILLSAAFQSVLGPAGGIFAFLGKVISGGLNVFLVWVGFAVYGKRLHDFRRTAFWHLLAWAFSVLVPLALLITAFVILGGGSESPAMMIAAVGSGVLIVFMWIAYTLWVGQSASDSENNKHGKSALNLETFSEATQPMGAFD